MATSNKHISRLLVSRVLIFATQVIDRDDDDHREANSRCS